MKKIGYRTIAQVAGVSTFTVSLALKNHSRVAIETRRKIQRIAARLGYVPNAALASVMAHTRASGQTRYQATLAYIDASASSHRDYYAFQTYKAGVVKRAHQLGYEVDSFIIDDLVRPPKAIERILLARGIRGMIMMWPHHQGIPPSWRQLWEKRSCVFLAARPEFPALPVAMSDHFSVGALAYKKAYAAGHRRISVVLDRWLHAVTEGRFMGGVYSQRELLHPAGQVPVLRIGEAEERLFLNWYKRHRPECIITMSFGIADYLRKARLKVPSDVSLVHWDVDPHAYGRWAGPEQHPAPIAHSAVDLLVSRIHHNTTGTAMAQTCLLTEPVWHDGASLRVARKKLIPPRRPGPKKRISLKT